MLCNSRLSPGAINPHQLRVCRLSHLPGRRRAEADANEDRSTGEAHMPADASLPCRVPRKTKLPNAWQAKVIRSHDWPVTEPDEHLPWRNRRGPLVSGRIGWEPEVTEEQPRGGTRVHNPRSD
jgi:hypothetical protein